MSAVVVATPGDRDIRIIRTFAAPRDLVWRAHTDPGLLRQWMLGPPGWTMPVCRIDLRVGGTYHWRWRSQADGTTFGFVGAFTCIQPPAQLAYTQRSDQADNGAEVAVIMTLEEDHGQTTL